MEKLDIFPKNVHTKEVKRRKRRRILRARIKPIFFEKVKLKKGVTTPNKKVIFQMKVVRNIHKNKKSIRNVFLWTLISKMNKILKMEQLITRVISLLHLVS